MTVLVLALVDGVVGAYLVRYAVTRERRDKPAVLVTGIFLLVCAAALMVIGLLPSSPRAVDDGQVVSAPTGSCADHRSAP